MPLFLKLCPNDTNPVTSTTFIRGESTTATKIEWIDCWSESWGMSRSVSPASGGPTREASLISISEISLTFDLGRHTPELFKFAASGQVIRSGLLSFMRTVGDRLAEYQTLQFSDLIISGFTDQADSDGVPVQSMSLNFTKIEMTTRRVRADGVLVALPKVGWDIVTGRATT